MQPTLPSTRSFTVVVHNDSVQLSDLLHTTSAALTLDAGFLVKLIIISFHAERHMSEVIMILQYARDIPLCLCNVVVSML